MHSGDRDTLADDPELQVALLQHTLSERFNPSHRGATRLEMIKGKRVAELHAKEGNATPQEGPRGQNK